MEFHSKGRQIKGHENQLPMFHEHLLEKNSNQVDEAL